MFIQNRAKEIRNLVDVACFKLIDTKRNPKDVVSRGVKPAELLSNRLWFSGPEFLTLDKDSWPSLKVGEKFILISEIELFRVTAFVYKFVENLKRKVKITKQVENKIEIIIINTEDIHAVSNLWLRHIQRVFHSNKYDDLDKKLNVFIDEHGLFRCRRRFDNSSLPYERKYPILLPPDSHLTVLEIQDNNGVRETINKIICKYWIPRVRQKVKNIINRCATCKKFERHPYFYPESPALPECRIVPNHCFSNIGIDYAVPVFLKNGSQLKLNGGMYKAWIALITCCTSRAIYLDIAGSLGGLACIKVLQRFPSLYE